MGAMSRNALGLLYKTARYSTTRPCLAASAFKMPSMSPTMEQGGIGEWKFKEGERFSAGDVLVTIETDKALVDVEAQEDGVLGRIFNNNGESGITVGDTIAAIGENENDDFSSIVPGSEQTQQEQVSSASTSSPESSNITPEQKKETGPIKHSKPLLPSVLLLLEKAGIADAEQIKGSGVRGMLTKGDVLAFLGKTTNPLGSASKLRPVSIIPENVVSSSSSSSSLPKLRDPTAQELRRMITIGLSMPRNNYVEMETPLSYDSFMDEYLTTNKTQIRLDQPKGKNLFDEVLGL